ncbi:MAG: DUF3108 domain-containing protein [Burkholderiaceae bacterium]
MIGQATLADAGRRRVLGAAGGVSALVAMPALGLAAEHSLTLQPFALDYSGYLVSGMGSTPLASARLTAASEGGRFSVELVVESFLADLTYRSRGIIDQHGLKPLQYQERRKVAFRSAREKTVMYVHTDDSKIQNTQVGDQLFVPTGAQDRLSLILQVIWMSRRQPQLLSNDAEFGMPFARVSRVSESRWRVRGPEPLVRQEDEGPSRGSRVSGYRITRVADQRDTVDVAFWLSADQKLQPLVLQFAEKGRRLRFVHDSV